MPEVTWDEMVAWVALRLSEPPSGEAFDFYVGLLREVEGSWGPTTLARFAQLVSEAKQRV